MHKHISVLGVITARGGSSGVKRKNVQYILNKPLLAYTIEAALQSKLLTRTIVSTEDDEIANIAKEYGAEVPFIRPEELATDNARSIEVIQHALRMTADEGIQYDYVMILQPTSPLRTSEDIDNCIAIASETDADSVMSMVELTDFSLPKLKKIENGIIVPFITEEGLQPEHRQASEPVYKRNTAIYLTKTEIVLKGDLFGKVSRAYIMPCERSVDINTATDMALAEFFLQRKV